MNHFKHEEPASNDDLMILFKHHFELLSETCQELLKLHYSGFSAEEISLKLNLGGVEETKNKKYYCREKLINMIKNDPLYAVIYG